MGSKLVTEARTATVARQGLTRLAAAPDDPADPVALGLNQIATTLPLMDGVATAGTVSEVSDAGHRHPTDTTRQAAYTNLTTIGSLANSAGFLYDDGAGAFSYVNIYSRNYSGAVVMPSFLDNGDGTVTLGAGIYNLHTASGGASLRIGQYAISGGTFTLTDGLVNYIYADYNSGSPALKHTTTRTDISSTRLTTAFPVYTIYRNGTELHPLSWGAAGVGMAEALLDRSIATSRFERNSTVGGLILSDSGSQNFSISAGAVWYGTSEQALDAFDSSVDDAYLYAYNGSTWSRTATTTFNNTQYQGPTGLVTLTNNRYAVNWIYRDVGDAKLAFVVLGDGDYSLSDAQRSQPDGLPTVISSCCILVGRVIVKKGDTVATQVDSAFALPFTASPTTNHNDLLNRDAADAHSASSVVVTPTGGIASTNVQAAFAEIDAEKLPITGTAANSSKLAGTTPSAFGLSLIDDADAAAARSTLGLVIGTNVQAYNANLAAVAAQTFAADRGIYWTSSSAASTFTLTSFARTILDDTTASAVRTTIDAAPRLPDSYTLETLPSVESGRRILVSDAYMPIGDGVICDGSSTVYLPFPGPPPSGAVLCLEMWGVRYQLYTTSRTNLATYSDQFDNAAWLKTQSGTGVAPAVTANYGTAPDGTSTADRVVFDRGTGTASSDYSLLRQSTGTSTTGWRSFWARATSGTASVAQVDTTFRALVSLTESWSRVTWRAPSADARIGLGIRGNVGSSQTADVLVWRGSLEDSSTLGLPILTTSDTASQTDYTVDAITGAVTLGFTAPAGSRLRWCLTTGDIAEGKGSAYRRADGTLITF